MILICDVITLNETGMVRMYEQHLRTRVLSCNRFGMTSDLLENLKKLDGSLRLK